MELSRENIHFSNVNTYIKMNILDFLPKYPFTVDYEKKVLNPYQDKFNNVIPTKKEFQQLKLEANQGVLEYGQQYKHQQMLARYMNVKTPYNGLLIFHEMGTGKTCTAIGIIEGIRYDKKSNFKGALIIVKGMSIARNFIQELFFSCTGGKYIPQDWQQLSDIQRINKLKKEYSKFYTFTTFEIFAKELKSSSRQELKKKYDNHIIVIDEVHNLREKDVTSIMDPKPEDLNALFNKPQLNIYKEFHTFLHLVSEVKIMLMSGTPMKDDTQEFASIMNLILPMDDQFVTGSDFNKRYFKNQTFKPDMIKEFSSKIMGKISYLKNSNTLVEKKYIGKKVGDLQHFIVYPTTMSEFQTRYYKLALTKDLVERNIYTNSRQASLFVFPNGTFGSEGFNQYMIRNEQNKNTRLTSVLKNALKGNSQQQTLEKLAEYSSKFASVIKIIIDSWPSKSIIYCEFVNGSGCILFSKILELFGFQKSEGGATSVGKRYAMLINQTTTDFSFQNIIKTFNDVKNIDGEYISVLIGSRVISEGYTFKNVTHEFILTPHWNYSETEQVIARGWRLGSHNDKIKRGDTELHVNIYQYVSIPQSDDSTTDSTIASIDLNMYQVSEKKDLLIKQIEYLVKINAFDCPLFIERNKNKNVDNQRDCEYTLCNYTCDGSIKTPLDDSTFNIYYASDQTVYTTLVSYFKTKNSIDLSTLNTLLPNVGYFEIINAIGIFINSNVIFKDRYGTVKFVRINNNNIFLVDSGFIPHSEPLLTFYYENTFIQNGDSFQDIINDVYNTNVPNILDLLFKQPENFSKLVSTIPIIVQRLLLESSIVARERKLNVNIETRKNILDMFTDFYGQVQIKNTKVWAIWLYRQELKSIVYWDEKDANEPGGLWLEMLDPTYVDNYIIEQRNRLLNTPIGFYGLYNPQLKEFCLRDVTQENNAKGDLRKQVVGRRCFDYSKPLLVDILANRIKQPFDSLFLRTVQDKKIKDMIKTVFNKYSMAEKKNISRPSSVEDCKRFLFYNNQTRQNLCLQIQDWLRRNNLVEQSFDCGTAFKTRSNIQ